MPTWLYFAILALGSPVGVIGVTATVALTRFVESLARRSGNEEAAKSAAFYGFAYRVSSVFTAFGLLFLTGATPLAFFTLVGVAGMLLFGALALVLPHRIITGMEKHLSRGRRNWKLVKPIAPDPHHKIR